MEKDERIEFFAELVSCCHPVYLWKYSKDGDLISSNCPEEAIESQLFIELGYRDEMVEDMKNYALPMIISIPTGYMWILDPQIENQNIEFIYVLGPFSIDDVPKANIEEMVHKMHMSTVLSRRVVEICESFPVISLQRAFEYAIMLHDSVNGERISISDLHYHQEPGKKNRASDSLQDNHSETIHGTYAAEQEMLRLVREGNLNYKEHMKKMSMIGSSGKLSLGDPERQMKNMVLVCVVLFSRAAIEGGVPPEISLTLCDQYFQSVEACKSVPELTQISHTMQEDFIQRVYNFQHKGTYSKATMACMDYIKLHLEEDISIDDLSLMLSYSPYYLSKKFKKETGITLKEYIRQQRVQRAKYLLKSTDLSVQEVSEKLLFCSPGYFSEVFRSEVGMAPGEWREQIDNGSWK